MKKLFVFAFTMLWALFLIAQEEYPAYTINVVTTNNADGIVDSLDVKCQLQGIVYGFNIRGSNGLQFTIVDANKNGIGVFSSTKTFDYTVAEGDEVIIRGTIDQFNGLTQILPDTLWRISQNNMLATPTVVSTLDESTESQLVQLENVSLVDPNDWTNAGSGFNVDVTNGTTTFQARIDADSDIFGALAPTGTFTLTGIGGQFDPASPYDAGYQIFPRRLTDINPYVPAASDFPPRSIGEVTTNNATGVADSLDVKCELQGIVYGINLRPTGLQFTIIDSNGDGIGVFLNSGNLGYTVAEGDLIKVRGEIDQFNGLTQILAEEIDLVSSGNALLEPTTVSELGEGTESQLIQIEVLTIVNPSQWTNAGSGFNVDVTDGTNTFQMRIDADTDIFGTSAPSSPFILRGIGSQFDNASPFTEGYQIIPRYLSDISLFSSVLDPKLAEGIKLYPNPVKDYLILESLQELDRIRITNALGQIILDQKNINSKEQFDVSHLSAGVYHIILIKENRYFSIEFVK
ncbi:MAG: T9SS type A sorting domain-containing protein [Saprospiraceae bacterium]|nr:T9SS type A sorting domain-containing protein [Saprospiraceae bacterium]